MSNPFLRNPFINNTPKSSPNKPDVIINSRYNSSSNDNDNANKDVLNTPRANINRRIINDSGNIASASNNSPFSSPTKSLSSPRKRLNMSNFGTDNDDDDHYGTKSLGHNSNILSSPVKKSRSFTVDYSSGNVTYFTDRFLPKRTEIDLNSAISIGSQRGLANRKLDADSDNQIEYQKEKHANHMFDVILKNELFGDKLDKSAGSSAGSTIDMISLARKRNTILNTTNLNSTPTHGVMGNSMDNTEDLTGINNGGGNRDDDNDNDNDNADDDDDYDYDYDLLLANRLLNSQTSNRKKPTSSHTQGANLLTYTDSTAKRKDRRKLLSDSFFDTSDTPVRPDSKRLLLTPNSKYRDIPKVPYRVLDAPGLADDFYYDLIDWSCTDLLAVVLGSSVFLTDNNTNEIFQLCTNDEAQYTSVSWVDAGSHLAVGLSNGLVEIYDVVKRRCIRTLSGHVDRVSCLTWNNHILTTGSKDANIFHRDVRMANPFFETIKTHSQEVCGLRWNPAENKLASGGNDNVVCVYDGTCKTPFMRITEHMAAVKAMAWSPHQRGVLATGGGTADKRLKIWNVNSSTKLKDFDTGSQICNMIWSKNTDEILTTHGYSNFQLTLWDYPTMNPIVTLKGHSFRVLHLTLSADGTTVVSGAGDETLRYWKLFEKVKKPTMETGLLSSFNKLR
ncbi:related to APC/C activator protein CDH1 [Saccharomycodes ludwigii]|uniref:Related to APC/C activator protein CDH1 n=1 Tax=Saccharomycodes ludwigii TaxID=36035 RepID=A0A376B6D1_9ASCO|nr:related to APC/C activator protein CDH1 [Saccharomycodes ludwigii]